MIVTAKTTTSTIFQARFNEPAYIGLADDSLYVMQIERVMEREGKVFWKVRKIRRTDAELGIKLRRKND